MKTTEQLVNESGAGMGCSDYAFTYEQLAAENAAQALVIEKMQEALQWASIDLPGEITVPYETGDDCACPVCEAIALDTSAATELLRKRDAQMLRDAAGKFVHDSRIRQIDLLEMADKIERGEA